MFALPEMKISILSRDRDGPRDNRDILQVPSLGRTKLSKAILHIRVILL